MTPEPVPSGARSDIERRLALRREQHRRAARDSLLAYATWTKPNYTIGSPHRRIAAKLEAVVRGEIDRLMIFAHPRIGKSELVSVRFPAWYFGKFPSNQMIAAAYGGELVSGFGAQVRNLVLTDEHEAVFGADSKALADVRARDLWYTQKAGVYRAAGVGGAITGFGANIFLIDDPVKSREEAASPIIQRRNWDWYRAEVYGRLMGAEMDGRGGAIIICQTRWDEEDLAGKLIQQMEEDADADQWEILHMPAIDENGEACWPEVFPIERLNRIRANIGPREWQAQWMGSPTPEDGDFFKAEWFHESTTKYTPKHVEAGLIRTYGATDAATTPEGGDFTVHIVVGVDPRGRIHVLDFWRKQASSDVWTDAMQKLAKKWKTLIWAEEKGQIRNMADPLIRDSQIRGGFWFRRHPFASSRDKETRALSIQGLMATGRVFWPKHETWVSTARSELLKFPAGKNDDIVDTMSLIGLMVTRMVRGKTPPPPPGEEPIFTVGEPDPDGPPMKTWADVIRVKGKRPTRAPEGRISVETEEGRMAALERLRERFVR